MISKNDNYFLMDTNDCFYIFKVSLSTNVSAFKRIIFPLFLLFIVLSVPSVIIATNSSEAVFDLLKNIVFIILFSVFTLLYSNVEDLRNVTTKLITLFSSIIISIGLYQLFRETGDGSTYRAAIKEVIAVFMNKNLYSQVLFLLLPFNIFSLYIFDKTWRALSAINSLLIITLITILLTRSVWAASFISGIIIILATLVDHRSGKKFRFLSGYRIIKTLIIIISTISLVFILLMEKSDLKIKAGMLSKMDMTKGTSQVRFAMWKNTIDMFKENTIFGVGGGNWKIQISNSGLYDDLKTKGKTQFQRPHNDYLWILSEYGILGLIAYLGIAFLGIYYLYKTSRTTNSEEDRLYYYLLLFGLIGYLIFSFFSYPKERITHNIYFYFILSIAVVDYDKISQKNPHLLSATKLLIPASLFITILAISLYTGIARFNGEKHARLAIDASHQSHYDKTINEVDKAYSWFYTMDPTATPISWYKGLAYFRKENTDMALSSFLESKQVNPFHSHTYNSIGIVYATKSDFVKAKESFLKALELRPYLTETIINLSRLYEQEENYQAAYEILQRIDPDTKNSNYKRILVNILENRIDELISTIHETKILQYIALARQSKPTTFAVYYASVKEEHTFEIQYLDYIAQQVLKNEVLIEEDMKNQIKTYLIEN